MGTFQWYGIPGKGGRFITKPIQFDEKEPTEVRALDAMLPSCRGEKVQTGPCVRAQERLTSHGQRGCITPTVGQFAPTPFQIEYIQAPLCVGTIVRDEAGDDPKGQKRGDQIQHVACLALDECEECPCEEDQCYDPKTRKCTDAIESGQSFDGYRACPKGSLMAKDCRGGGRTQEKCQAFSTRLKCPDATQCARGQHALQPVT